MSDKFATYNAKRTRNWSVIFWVDDLPSDWLDELKTLGFKWALSPIHDKDFYDEKSEEKNPENKAGTPKKKHHHAVFIFPSQKTQKQICDLFGGLFGYGETENSVKGVQFQKCGDLFGSVQYFIHKKEPKKAQYDVNDIQGFNGFDVEKYLNHELTQEEQREILNRIEEIIEFNDITELTELSVILKGEEDKTLLDFVRIKHRAYFRDYLYSRRGIAQAKVREERIIQDYLKAHGMKEDKTTGRIIHI